MDKKTLIVTYEMGIGTDEFKEAKKGLKFKKEEKLKKIHMDILEFETEQEALDVKLKLEKRPNVMSVNFNEEIDIKPLNITNEPSASTYNYHMRPNNNIPNDNFDWLKLKHIDEHNTNTANALIAIIDLGFKTDHPDLSGKLLPGYHAVKDKTEPDISLLLGTEDHGTLVCGMAAAITNNGRDASSIGGIFKNVKIIPMYANAFAITIVRAIDYAITAGCVAISMSWYLEGVTLTGDAAQAMMRAYLNDIVLFAAAMNDGRDNNYYDVKHLPTDLSWVYKVGNALNTMTLTSSSNYGTNKFIGNGTNVIKLKNNDSSSNITGGGTSSACPHVASIYAAMKAVAPNLSREQIIQIMSDTAYLKGGDSYKLGDGYPNAVEAIRLARAETFTKRVNSTPVAVNKSWTVVMTQNVDATKLKGVYVLALDKGGVEKNTKGKEHPVSVTVSGKNITVTPTTYYKPGKEYLLVVSDVYSTSGSKLTGNQTLQFKTILLA